MLAARCPDAHTRDRLAEEMKWYDDYLDGSHIQAIRGAAPGHKDLEPNPARHLARPADNIARLIGWICRKTDLVKAAAQPSFTNFLLYVSNPNC
mgnify:CR=1 FL=1